MSGFRAAILRETQAAWWGHASDAANKAIEDKVAATSMDFPSIDEAARMFANNMNQHLIYHLAILASRKKK